MFFLLLQLQTYVQPAGVVYMDHPAAFASDTLFSSLPSLREAGQPDECEGRWAVVDSVVHQPRLNALLPLTPSHTVTITVNLPSPRAPFLRPHRE